MSNKYKFYFQRYPIGVVEQEIKDLEIDFLGCQYLSCSGISDYGEIKNIEIEEYPESSEPRVFIPDTINRSTTKVTFTLRFVGDYYRDSYDEFIDYISGYKLKYWDTYRKRLVHLLFTGNVSVTEDLDRNYKKYLIAEIEFTNLKGLSEKKL